MDHPAASASWPAPAREREETLARQAAVDAALDRLDDLAVEYPDHLRAGRPAAGPVRRTRPTTPGRTATADLDEADRERLDHQAIRLAVVEAQREAVIRLRDDGVIGDEALRASSATWTSRRSVPASEAGRSGVAWYPPRDATPREAERTE